MVTTLPTFTSYSDVLQELSEAVQSDPFMLRKSADELILTDIDYDSAVKSAVGSLELEIELLGKANIPIIDPSKPPINYVPSFRKLQDIVDEADRLIEKGKSNQACNVLTLGLAHIEPQPELTEQHLTYYGMYAVNLKMIERYEEVERLVGFLEYFNRVRYTDLNRITAEAYYAQAETYIQSEQIDPALELLEKAAKFTGDTPSDLETRALILLRIAELYDDANETALCLEFSEMVSAVIKEARKEEESVAGRVLHLKANCALAYENTDEAFKFLENAIAIYERAGNADPPYLAAAYKDYGVICSHNKRLDEAQKALQKAIKILEEIEHTEGANEASICLSDVLMELNKLNEAEAEISKALARPTDSHSPRIKLSAAMIYRQIGRLDEALMMAKEANKHYAEEGEPDEETAIVGHSHLVYGELLFATGQIEKAEKQLKRAIEELKDKEDWKFELFSASLELGKLYYSQENLELAYTYAFKAYEIADTDTEFDSLSLSEACVLLGRVMQDQSKTEGVKQLFKRALKIKINNLGATHPDIFECYLTYGAYLLQNDDLIKAETALLKSAEIVRTNSLPMSDPNVSLLYEMLIRLYTAKDDPDAVERLERIRAGIVEK